MGVVKKYVGKGGGGEGRMGKGYGREEVMEFWVEFMEEVGGMGVGE